MRMNTDISLEKAGEFLCRKMSTLAPLNDALMRDLRTLTRDRIEIPAGRPVVNEDERCPQLYLIGSGWVLRSRGLASGRRQIVNFSLPGDFLCGDSILYKACSFDLVARTGLTLFRIETPILTDLFAHHHGLAAAIAWAAGQDESVIAERVVSLGRRDSLEKLAHILCEIAARLESIGQLKDDTIQTPLNQEDFADMLGISVIHVNRTFRRLSEEKIAEYRKGQIELLDRERLAEISAFDPSYLQFGRHAA